MIDRVFTDRYLFACAVVGLLALVGLASILGYVAGLLGVAQ